MIQLRLPKGIKPNPGYWLSPKTWVASRRAFMRRDNSTSWRASFPLSLSSGGPSRSVPFSELLGRPTGSSSFRFVILGDTGEGDRSQYALLPLIRGLDPDWMVVNGDVAYPAGRRRDFVRGFFEPYRNLGIPIWAVPGNHEYYSRDKGRTFFDVFCTQGFAPVYAEHGLPLVPQPGTYWEVKEPGHGGLAVIALDTGMKGNLDGRGLGKREDREQHEWLRDRLSAAERERRAVLALFHIPKLVDERDQSIHLERLHRLLARSPAVRLIVCGHIHNHQGYSQAVFGRFLAERIGQPAAAPPHYVVSGGGGAYLSKPSRHGEYRAEFFFPDHAQWTKHASMAEKAMGGLGLARSAIGRVAAIAGSTQRLDDDAGRFLSLLVVDVHPGGNVEARHALLEDVEELFDLPDGSVVWLDDPNPRIDRAKLDAVLSKYPAISL